MKETVNVNIGSQAFTIDRDAHSTLNRYFDQIGQRLTENQIETMEEIEWRFAEIFRENIGSSMRVVNLGMVNAAIEQMGEPSTFGESPINQTDPSEQNSNPQNLDRRIYRSINDRSIGGVCAGIAEYFDIDTTLLRIITLLLLLVGGVSFWIYIILWIIIPKVPINQTTNQTYKN